MCWTKPANSRDTKCNRASVDLEPLEEKDIEELRYWIARHAEDTGSPRANWILENWDAMLPKFVKVFPHEYKRVLGVKRQAVGRSTWVKSPAFSNTSAKLPSAVPSTERVNDWFEIYQDFPLEKVQTQGARCMDCGVPFCHTGCPLNNIIPDWNDLVLSRPLARSDPRAARHQ